MKLEGFESDSDVVTIIREVMSELGGDGYLLSDELIRKIQVDSIVGDSLGQRLIVNTLLADNVFEYVIELRPVVLMLKRASHLEKAAKLALKLNGHKKATRTRLST